MGYKATTMFNVRVAKGKGHNPLSGGCGWYRCDKCGLGAFLDTDADFRWFERCPGKPSEKPEVK